MLCTPVLYYYYDKYLETENNGCFNGSIGCSNCSISEENLENVLGECYKKYYQIERREFEDEELEIIKQHTITSVELSESSERDKFTFNGTEEEKQNVTVFYLDHIPKIYYIPVEIFTEFPNLEYIL
jgi:hypothetical protein